MERSQLVPFRQYYVADAEAYAVTPDCVGVYWYDSRTEMQFQHGEEPIHRISSIAD